MLNENDDIMKEIKRLDVELYKIQCRNWVPSLGHGSGAAGKTLEELLGKNEDRYVLPDYNGIELKTRSDYSAYPVHLFSCAFDNRPLEMQRLLKFAGYPDKKYPEFRVFNVRVNAVSDKKVGKFTHRIYVNYEKEEVELRVKYSKSGDFYTKMSWSFMELKSRLLHKMRYVAIVNVRKERVKEQDYFRFYNHSFYKLKGFDEFLSLIDSGDISVSFKLTYYHSGERFGEYQDKGTGFEVSYESILKLFDKIEL